MRILLGVTGGVAAYKAAELLRLLQGRGATVEVAMTASAERFVTAQTFAALSGRRVYRSLWQEDAAAGVDQAFEIEHITVSQRIDVLLIAPCTANTMARLAHGLADDFLSALALATPAPLVIAPAMNVGMWRHPATQANVARLRRRGVRFVEPDSGYLACGMTGGGRLAALPAIVDAVFEAGFAPATAEGAAPSLAGETILITAGGTREPIDPVRFLGNRSSGRMGHALAAEAARRGAAVVLVTASPLPSHPAVARVEVATAAEMRDAVLTHLPPATVVFGAAAVADYRVATVSAEKLRRNGPRTLVLEPTEDILAEAVARRSPGTLIVAFAAETAGSDGVLEAAARAKLARKGVDAIVANDVSRAGIGFESERNAGLFLTSTRAVVLPEESKAAMAGRVLDEAATELRRVRAEAAAPLRV